MRRRKFLAIIAGTLGIGFMSFLFFKMSSIRKYYYKITSRFDRNDHIKPDHDRIEAIPPAEGPTTSVETALNSRCTSDYDGNPKLFHWGMFDGEKKLSQKVIEQVVKSAQIPRFTPHTVAATPLNNTLSFTTDQVTDEYTHTLLMVESGMLQQAIGLTCAALGIGYAFSSQSTDGRVIEGNKFETMHFKINAMKPSYDKAYWTVEKPTPWQEGNLPQPSRQGHIALLSALAELRIQNSTGRKSTLNDLGQLLWAARGRTPHYSMSEPWGLTIPRYHGQDNISQIYILTDDNIFKYLNWVKNKPTHTIEKVKTINNNLQMELLRTYQPFNGCIVFSTNENNNRALWEVGYQMLNIMLQAHVLGIAYKAVLLGNTSKKAFHNLGTDKPVAVLCVTQ